MKAAGLFMGLALLLVLLVPAAGALDVVSTTSVLWDPIQYIGGEQVNVIYIADPTICPHMQSDIIPSRIQMEREFISTADLFVAHNGSVDAEYVMPYVDDFMQANGYGEVAWVTLNNSSMVWNTPSSARELANETKGWLVAADPQNATLFEERYAEYVELINASDLSDEERGLIAGQDAIVMVWQQEPAEVWLGLNVVNIYAPEFYMGGNQTAARVVDDIIANPDKYADVRYIIENMQSGEMAKGVEEALLDRNVTVERVIFTNFPKSLPGVDSIPDVLAYNKGLVTPEQTAEEGAAGS
jgi:zinc/manganese transport system substrate-binding protein